MKYYCIYMYNIHYDGPSRDVCAVIIIITIVSNGAVVMDKIIIMDSHYYQL